MLCNQSQEIAYANDKVASLEEELKGSIKETEYYKYKASLNAMCESSNANGFSNVQSEQVSSRNVKGISSVSCTLNPVASGTMSGNMDADS